MTFIIVLLALLFADSVDSTCSVKRFPMIFGGTVSSDSQMTALVVDSNENIYVGGRTNDLKLLIGSNDFSTTLHPIVGKISADNYLNY